MVESPIGRDVGQFRELADRILASSQLNRSARLSELFQYLCHRVLDEDVQNIHELELGQRVFGRPARYDTTADNIVRVHASMLRKRLAEYFETDGRDEEFIVKIPRGNYAPVFERRGPAEIAAVALEITPPAVALASSPVEPSFAPLDPAPRLAPFAATPPRGSASPRWMLGIAIAAALAFALLSSILYLRLQRATAATAASSTISGPFVTQFWASVFPPKGTADVVIDDASLGLYEEATGKSIPIGDYFDRTYMRGLFNGPGPPEHDPNWLHQLVLRRQSNYAASSMVWRLAQIASAEHNDARLQFARDLSFQQAKLDNLVLLGNATSNPWIQLFESSLTLHWVFDAQSKAFYPVDTTAATDPTRYKATDESKTHDGFATVSLLSNLSGSGKTFIISGSGGAATDAAMNWLMRDASLRELRSRLPQTGSQTGTQTSDTAFPPFEALLRIEKSIDRPRSVTLAIVRPARPGAPRSSK